MARGWQKVAENLLLGGGLIISIRVRPAVSQAACFHGGMSAGKVAATQKGSAIVY
jgi:hypothetical protein